MDKSIPRPWAIKHRQDGKYGVGQGNWTAAVCDSVHDANLIVTAVNRAEIFEEIIGRLYECQGFLATMKDHSGAISQLKTMEKAIAKAEGKFL